MSDFENNLRHAVSAAHIRELQRQLNAALRENVTLREKLAAWPARAVEHALRAREREAERLVRETVGRVHRVGGTTSGVGVSLSPEK